MKELSVLEYLQETELLEELARVWEVLPNTIENLLEVLEQEELNYWSYAIEDKDEIKDYDITVLVKDINGNERYFETLETVVW